MMRPSSLPLFIIATGLLGCVTDKQLASGESVSSSTTASPDESETTNDEAGASETTSTPASEETGSTMTASSSGTDSGGPRCLGWEPEPGPCVQVGSAYARLSGSSSVEDDEWVLEDMDDAPCTVVSVESVDATTETLRVECDSRIYAQDVYTSAPHIPLPLSPGQPVRVTAGYFGVEDGWGSLTIRAENGDLLFAWINESESLVPSVDLEPLEFEAVPSGCPGISKDPACEGDDIIGQRYMVRVGMPGDETEMFGGMHRTLSTPQGNIRAIVSYAYSTVCWGEGCHGLSDSEGMSGMLIASDP